MSPPRKRMEDVRCPAVKGMPDEIYHILHRSFVGILTMRKSIESMDVLIEESNVAILDSCDVLKRLRDNGF